MNSEMKLRARRRGWLGTASAAAAGVALAGLIAVLAPGVARSQAAGELDWIQLGANIDGENRGDRSGGSVAMNSDGSRIAIGAQLNDDNGQATGHVRVYDFDGANWVQVGGDIDGEARYDRSSDAVVMSSDGNRIAIGAWENNGSNGRQSGHVRVYDFNGANWVQTGTDIDGEAQHDESGYSVAMSSNGNRIAIGARANGDNGSGHVRVYDYDGTNWVQVGSDIDGEAPWDRSGESVAMSSDGNRIAIGAPSNDGNGPNAGHVRVYDFDGTNWNQTGTDIDGGAAADKAGREVAISSDGNRIAIGAPSYALIGPHIGQVRVYDFDGTNWNQTGSDIDREAQGDSLGHWLAMNSDGTRIAIGSPSVKDVRGHVQVYDLDGTNWNQTGTDIDGEAPYDWSGDSVAMSSSGMRIVSGAQFNDGNGSDSGHARVHELAPVEFSLSTGDVIVLRNVASGRYLDGDGVRKAWNVDTSPTARWDAGWRLSDNGDGSWSLLNRRRTRYLDADGDGQDWNVSQSVTVAADDKWEIVDNGDGTHLLRNTRYGRYLAQEGTNNKNVITVADVDIDNLARWEITIAS